MGLPPAASFADVSPSLAPLLAGLYGSPSNADAYVAGMAEAAHRQSHVGQLFYESIRRQFAALRDGDFWYYGNGAANGLWTAADISEIQGTGERLSGGPARSSSPFSNP
jgi:hypothetical protein